MKITLHIVSNNLQLTLTELDEVWAGRPMRQFYGAHRKTLMALDSGTVYGIKGREKHYFGHSAGVFEFADGIAWLKCPQVYTEPTDALKLPETWLDRVKHV